MMSKPRLLFFVLASIGLTAVLLVWQSGKRPLALGNAIILPTTTTIAPTSQPTATALPTANPSPTPQPSSTPTTVPTETPPPTSTPSPSPTPSPTAQPTVVIDRTCPDPVPLKPNYIRNFLPAEEWPRPESDGPESDGPESDGPESDVAEPHFLMSKPLPGGGRLLINQWFPYGWDANGRYLLHNGVDVAEDLGTAVIAVADGTIVTAQDDLTELYGWRCDWYGQLVVLELDEQWQGKPIYAVYGHVLNLKVEEGDRVEEGDELAEVGFGGAATAPHLHFEVRVGENTFDATQNPMLWLDPGVTRGVVVGRLVDPNGWPWQGVKLVLTEKETGHEALTTWSYLEDPTGRGSVNPDTGWAENFVFADIRPGEYEIEVEVQEVTYRADVTVTERDVSVIEFITEPFKEISLEKNSNEE